jgi:hypothetical protein
MSDMGNIKVKHRGGDSASKPSIDKKSHPMQKPGNADKNHASKMSWSGTKK